MVSDTMPAPQVDRSVPTVASLAAQMTALKGEFELQGRKLDDLHEAVFGDGNGNPGLRQTLEDVHAVVTGARSVLRVAQSVANGTGKSADAITNGVKRYWIVLALVVGAGTYLKTGHWPDWVFTVFAAK